MPLPVAAVWWAAVAVLAMFALSALGLFELSSGLENRLEWAIFVAAAVVCVARAVLVAEARLMWGLFGAGLSLYAVGWVVHLELQPAGSPSWSDALWLSFYALAFGAVGCRIRARLRHGRSWLWLDGSIAGLALVSIALRVCLGPVLEGSTAATVTIVTGASYLGLDLLMLGVLSALFTLQRGLSRSGALVFGAFCLLASMDAVYAYQTAHGMAWQASLDDAVWGVAALLLARAAWARQGHTARATEANMRTLVPAGAALLAVTYELSSSSHPVASLFTLSTVVLVTARLWLSGRESAELLKQASASRDELQASIAQRIREEQERRELEAQLHQSQKLETVGRLAGGIAHDFNNLLAVILNYAEFASSELGSHPARADVDEIRRAAERAAGLTRQLLVFSRGDRTQATSIDVNAVVRAMSSMLGRTLGEQIELHAQLDHAAPTAYADSTQLEQVLMNLAVNARDAMADGGRLVISTGGEVLSGGQYVRVTVSDDGSGMSEDTRARAFDPFFTTKPPGQGTGLGLATVYGLVTRAGGQVQCTSALGHGTAVSVLLPAATSVPAEVREPPEETEAAEATVLLVEDEEALRRMARRLLESEGYRVISAPNGEAALEALETLETDVDLLLTDVVMPGMSGVDLADELSSRRPGVPVVFMSGYSERADRLPPGSRFVPKPFKRADLLEAVAAGAQSLRVA